MKAPCRGAPSLCVLCARVGFHHGLIHGTLIARCPVKHPQPRHQWNPTLTSKSATLGWGTRPWPKENDAVIAAPRNHKILLENKNVRVLDVTVAPGETEPVHSHRWPSVLYVLAAGDFIDRDGEGDVILDTRQLKTPLQYPMTIWKDPEAPHAVENLSKTITLHLIRVEMKKIA